MAATKKTPAKGTRTTAAKQKAAEAQARKRLYAILLFALGALVVAISAVPGEKLWLMLHHFLLGSFSWCAYLLGPIIIYTAVMVDLDKSTFPIAAKVISSVVLVVMLCGASHIFSKAIPPEGGLLSLIDWLYKSGIRLEGGGAAGILLGIPLMHWLDFTGAAITIVVLIFVSLMIISGSTLVGLFKNALVKPVRRMEEAYVTAAVNRAQLAEEAERPQGKKAQRQAQMMMGENKTKLMEAVNAMDKPVGGTTGAPGPGTAVPTAGPNERFFDFDAHNREDKPQPQPKPTVKPAPIDAPEDIFGPEPPKAEKPAAKPADKPAPPPQPPQEVLPPGELTLDEIISRAAQPGGQRPASQSSANRFRFL